MDRSASWESKDAMFIMIVRGEVDRSASWESKDAMFIMIVRGEVDRVCKLGIKRRHVYNDY